MKTLALICLTVFGLFTMSFTPKGNSGKGFNYQGVARDADGQPKASENIELQFSLLPSPGLDPSWQESHVATTSPFGVFSVIVGKGIKTGGTAPEFKDVDFSQSDYWMKVEVKENGSWQEISQFQLPSMPYAEVAESSKNNAVPVGSIMPFAGPKENIPEGWMLCDGKKLSRSDYPGLYNTIGTAWGHGDGTTTFHIPDLRGLFLRGVDYDKGIDKDKNNRTFINEGGNTNNNVGSQQQHSFDSHKHSGRTSNSGAHGHRIEHREVDGKKKAFNVELKTIFSGNNGGWAQAGYAIKRENKTIDGKTASKVYVKEDGSHKHDFTTSSTGGKETRPVNAYVNYIIKY